MHSDKNVKISAAPIEHIMELPQKIELPTIDPAVSLLGRYSMLISHIYLGNQQGDSSIDRHLGCFQTLAIVDNAAMNVGLQVYL